MAWKVTGELQSPKNITVGSYNLLLVVKATFHSWPFFIHTALYPHRMLNFVKRVHPLRWSVCWGISGRVLPPEQAAELLPWYMQWSRDLAGEMHRRRLVRDKAHRANALLTSYPPCDCTADWRCEPHDACFIHDSCFCPGSGSFPPVKPPR